jgi:hypothetical protein
LGISPTDHATDIKDRQVQVAINSEMLREGRRRCRSRVEADLFARAPLPPPQRRTIAEKP